jgi:hypothetical protein
MSKELRLQTETSNFGSLTNDVKKAHARTRSVCFPFYGTLRAHASGNASTRTLLEGHGHAKKKRKNKKKRKMGKNRPKNGRDTSGCPHLRLNKVRMQMFTRMFSVPDNDTRRPNKKEKTKEEAIRCPLPSLIEQRLQGATLSTSYMHACLLFNAF